MTEGLLTWRSSSSRGWSSRWSRRWNTGGGTLLLGQPASKISGLLLGGQEAGTLAIPLVDHKLALLDHLPHAQRALEAGTCRAAASVPPAHDDVAPVEAATVARH